MEASRFFGVPFEKIAEEHLDKLKADEVSEGYLFEFKRDFPQGGAGKSIAAFANTHGGYLLIGVEADKVRNVIIDIPGIPMVDGLQEKVKSQVLSSVNPVPLFRTTVVPLSTGQLCVLIVEVPESSDLPHFTKDGRIYVRTPTGSDPIPEANRYEVEKLFGKAQRNRAAAEQLIRTKLDTSHVIEAGHWGLNIVLCPAMLDAFSLGLATRAGWEKLKATAAQALGGLDYQPTQEGLHAFWREDNVYREILGIADNGVVYYFIQPEYEAKESSPGVRFLNLPVIEDRLNTVLSLAGLVYNWAEYWGTVRLALGLSKVKGAALQVPQKNVSLGGRMFVVQQQTRPNLTPEQDDYRIDRGIPSPHIIDPNEHPKIRDGITREVRRCFHYEAFDDE